jgi:hypothetical protein
LERFGVKTLHTIREAQPILVPVPHSPIAICQSVLLIQRIKRQHTRFGVRARASRVDANHAVFLGTERANPCAIRH